MLKTISILILCFGTINAQDTLGIGDAAARLKALIDSNNPAAGDAPIVVPNSITNDPNYPAFGNVLAPLIPELDDQIVGLTNNLGIGDVAATAPPPTTAGPPIDSPPDGPDTPPEPVDPGYTRDDYCQNIYQNFESGAIAPYQSLGRRGVQRVNRGPKDDPYTVVIDLDWRRSRQLYTPVPLPNQRSFYTSIGRLGNRVTGIHPRDLTTNPKGGPRYAATYIHAGEFSLMQVSFQPLLEEEEIGFLYFKTAEKIQFRMCCDTLSECPKQVTDTQRQNIDTREWEADSIKCPAGTKRLIWVCESVSEETLAAVQGACGVDTIQCLGATNTRDPFSNIDFSQLTPSELSNLQTALNPPIGPAPLPAPAPVDTPPEPATQPPTEPPTTTPRRSDCENGSFHPECNDPAASDF